MQAFTQRLAAFSAILTLLVFLSSISLSQASLTEPLIKLETLPPESADGSFPFWIKHNKYFLLTLALVKEFQKLRTPSPPNGGMIELFGMTKGASYEP